MGENPVESLWFGVDLDGISTRPGLTEDAYKVGRDPTPTGVKSTWIRPKPRRSRRGRGLNEQSLTVFLLRQNKTLYEKLAAS